MANTDELEELANLLSGPVGFALTHAGTVIARKLRERGQALSDLDDLEVADLMHAALVETAEMLHPGPTGQELCRRLRDIFAVYGLEMRASAPTSPSMQ